MNSRETALKIAEIANAKKAKKIRILQMIDLTIVAEYFVIASVSNITLMQAIADNIEDGMTETGIRLLRKEGAGGTGWILLDYGDVVVHIFLDSEREFYNLEGLWADAPTEKFGGEE